MTNLKGGAGNGWEANVTLEIKSKHLQPALRKISIALASIIFALISLELLLRLIPCPISPVREMINFVEDERVYTLRPDAKLLFNGVIEQFQDPVLWEVNSQGIRDDRIIYPYPKTGKTPATRAWPRRSPPATRLECRWPE